MKKYFLVVIGLMLCFGIKAQKVVNVATQRFEEQVSFTPGKVLKLDLEKVQVSIIGVERDFYEFEITFKSKHKDQKQAIKELGYLKYQLKEVGDTIYFSNDFVSGDTFQKIQGVLNVELLIKAPKSGELVVKNAYGKTFVRNVSASIDLNGKFVETKINECEGDLKIVSAFGEHQINEYEGNLILNLSRVDLMGSEIKGEVRGKTSYGSININELSSSHFEMDSRRTAFTLTLGETSLQYYHFDLASQLGSILVEGAINEKVTNQWKYEGTSDSTIKIKTTFSPIIIRDQSLNARRK